MSSFHRLLPIVLAMFLSLTSLTITWTSVHRTLPITAPSSLGVVSTATTAVTRFNTYPLFSHILIIMMENKGIYNICARSPPPCNGPSTPYMSQLANSYGIASQYTSLGHPSLPDYVGPLGGNTYGCIDSCSPVAYPNLVDRLETAGLTWKAYMEDYTGGCNGTYGGLSTPDHNGFIHFQDIVNNTTRCNRIVDPGVSDGVLLSDLSSNTTAPNYMWLTPNDCHNMRNTCAGQPQTGDNYLAGLVPQILNSTVFKTTNAALVITFDEGEDYCPLNGGSEDCLYTVWAGPVVKTSFSSSRLYSHYSLLATIEKIWNLNPLTSNDTNALPMNDFFYPLSPDLNSDGIVDISDLTLVAARIGIFSGTPRYVPRYDLNQDGVTDITDLVIVASYLGNLV